MKRNPQKKRFLYIASITVFLFIGVGCSRTPEKISTESEISVTHQDITVTQSPQTILVRPGDTTTLKAELQAETDKSLRARKKTWEWISRSDEPHWTSESSKIEVGPLDKSRTFQVNLKIIWESKRTEKLYRESITHSLKFAVAARKSPEERRIDGYIVGPFPRIQSDITILGNKAVVSQSEKVPYYETENTLEPLGHLESGDRFDLINESATRNLALANINGQPVYISSTELWAPYIVRKHKSKYNAPVYYFPVTQSNRNGWVIPGLQWKYFDHDSYYREEYGPDLPHYIPIERLLLKKIVGLRNLLKQRGHPSRIVLISGIRNPAYNQSEVQTKGSLKAIFSRHQYGDAVDLIVDSNADGVMDDLNGDDDISIEDARVIAELMNIWEKRHNKPGGIGTYSHHDVKGRKQTSYVHIDTRGYKARWSIE